MTKRLISCGVLATLACGTLTLASLSQGQEKTQVAVDKTYAVMKPLIADPFYLQLNPNRALWTENKYEAVIPPDEQPEHPLGIFWISNIGVGLPVGEPSEPSRFGVSSFGQSHVRIINARQLASEDQCRENGLTFLRRQFSWDFSEDRDAALLLRVTQPDWDYGEHKGVWAFDWWQPNKEGLAETQATVLVRAIDGKVVGFSTQKESWPPHKLSFSEIEPSLLRLLSQGRMLKHIVVGPTIVYEGNVLTHGPDVPAMVFQSQVSAIDEQGQSIKTTVLLDAATGQPVWIDSRTGMRTEHKIQWQSLEGGDEDVAHSPPSAPSAVAMPLWVNQKLLRITACRSEGMPSWIPLLSQVVLSGTTGSRQITQDLEVSPRALYGLPNASWFGMERHGWTYAVNAQTGDYRVLGTPERGGATPTISADGKWAVVSATGHLGSSDSDLFADNLQRGPDLQLRARLVIPQSEETFPLFSPDGKWLYFVSIAEKGGKVTQILRRIPAELAHAKDIVRLKPEQITDLMPLPLEDIARLSIFPNGHKLLMQSVHGRTEQQMDLLDLATLKATPLKLSTLKDTELKGAAITKLEDGWAGPSDNEVTFSGETTDAAKVVRRRIYSCRFDGSGLKALTPKANTPVAAYTFAATKKSATDLAREWALREIAWDKVHADR